MEKTQIDLAAAGKDSIWGSGEYKFEVKEYLTGSKKPHVINLFFGWKLVKYA